MKKNALIAGIAPGLVSRQMALNIRQAENVGLLPVYDGGFKHDRVCAANASLFNQSFFSEPLTTYAVGYPGQATTKAELDFIAPEVPVNRRFEYATDINAEQFLSDLTDDERPLRGKFKNVEYNSDKVQAKTANRGLMMCIDLDEVADKANWQENAVNKLINRIQLSSLRRAAALIIAGATDNAKTWDTSAGKDPDQDVLGTIVTATTASGVRPNRAFYGETAWSKRMLAHRAQTAAGGFGSAGMPPQQVAALLMLEDVMVSKTRYQSTASAKAEAIGGMVLLFNAQNGVDTEDPSNIKRFISPVEGGGYVRVYVQYLTAKLVTVTVEHYELTKLTSTAGLYKMTIS